MRTPWNYEDLTGQKFNKLTVLRRLPNAKNGRTTWECKCDCGKITKKMGTNIKSGHIKSCGCLRNTRNHNDYGRGEINMTYFTTLHGNAEKRGMAFDLTMEELWNQFLKQDRKCALTGLDLVFVKNYRNAKKFQTASLDRIDSTKLYTKDNIQWVHKHINRMKMNDSEEYFIEMCRKVVNYEDNVK